MHSEVRDLSREPRFGRLKAIKRVGMDKRHKESIWLCDCLCGRSAIVRKADLLNGHTRSCGCLADERKSLSRVLKKQKAINPDELERAKKRAERKPGARGKVCTTCLVVNGVKKNIYEWAVLTGQNVNSMRKRLIRGMSHEEVVLRPRAIKKIKRQEQLA